VTARAHAELVDLWSTRSAEMLDSYRSGTTSFVPRLLPELALRLSALEVIDLLRGRFGDAVDAALAPEHTDPGRPASDHPPPLRSPVSGEPDGRWLQTSNMVGINVRTIGTVWDVVAYTLTVPGCYDAVHLLPIWEPGVVDSLYGPASWELNTEFFSEDLAGTVGHLDSIGRQLKAVVNLLHLSGRAVGLDVIPHTDRFSQIALSRPGHFEWMRRRDTEIVDHSDDLHEAVEQLIADWLDEVGPAVAGEPVPDRRALFSRYDEDRTLRVLFGAPSDLEGRTRRRAALVRRLHEQGFEPVPATMGVPFRGITVDPDSTTTDEHGMTWYDYVIERPEPMSRVFNPLARYKLYGRVDDNRHWGIDFSAPRPAVWDYVGEHYAAIQAAYGFDFMRGDMSHVQMRPGGVPAELDEFYDILGTVKERIRAAGTPWFGYFAETFLPPRDVFGYGEELDHLEASEADTTLGDLQSTVVGSDEFIARFRRYLDIAETRSCRPCFTVMTSDKDDPRFDAFYRKGSEVRLFLSLLVTDLPSYVALGYETRDVHLAPAPNEHYTKLFVFHEHGDSNVYPSKARTGDYVWGSNGPLFDRLTDLRLFAEDALPRLSGARTVWLLPPGASTRVVAWTQQDEARYLFVANLDVDRAVPYLAVPPIPGIDAATPLRAVFSTHAPIPDDLRPPAWNGKHHRIEGLDAGEGRAYRIG
jgi:hypothetical protein